MNEEVKTLIDSLRRGQYEDPAEKIGLLSAALKEHGAEISVLVSLLRAPQIPLRLAAIDACRGRPETELAEDLSKLVEDEDERVREKLAAVLQSLRTKRATEALQRLAQDSAEDVRLAAVKSTSGRPEFAELQQTIAESDPEWQVRIAAISALGEQKNPASVVVLLKVLAQDSDDDVARRCAELIEKRLVTTRAAAEKFLPGDIAQLTKAERALKSLGGQRFPTLMAWITAQTTITVDPQALAKFGTDLTALALERTLPRAYRVEEACETVLKLLRRDQWRSIALLGAAGTGKSALVNELTYELAKPENGGWRVLRISPTDFMSDTRYLGEWETKVRHLVEAIKKPRRVLIYVPNLSDLSAVGTWSKSDSSVATALAPYMEEGSILLLGESAPEQFERGLGRIPSLQRLFDRVLVSESTADQTLAVLSAVRDEQQLSMSDAVLAQLMETAAQFLSHISRPGNAVALLRAVAQSAKESGRPASFRDVLDCLSKSTGLPADLLDDSLPLNQAETRAFFESRIIGQAEAVDAVVDLVTLIKAGLTDSQKPFGVMLFIGPTGVGKTELARALAEYIFGNANRLKRFDMSEFASADSFVRLMGSPGENGLLTGAVRQQPFSVVLLDEIEKSHVNVFDLCLQIFDAGRLTDGTGRTADFRRAIVILTSNIGATAPTSALGFQAVAGAAPPDADKDRTFRELSRVFRPEFLNRLDRIVQFRPLTLEVAEQIARREMDQVLQRSGIRRRELAVDVDPSIISLLVREGYSPHFGARPLKRTVERLLLLPLARTISGGALPARAILHLTQNAGRVEVSVTSPSRAEPPKVVEEQRAAESLQAESALLLQQFMELEPQVRPLADRKSELLLRTQEPGFYQDAAQRAATFDEVHKLDQFLALREGLGKALQGLHDRLERRPPSPLEEPALRERCDQFRAELDQLRLIAGSKDARDLGDVLLSLSLVERVGEKLDAVEKLAGMYLALAQRRRMSAEVLGEFFDAKQDRAWLMIGGLGAYALLKQESGLHRLDFRTRQKKQRTGREAIREDRESVRVDVQPIGGEPAKSFRQAVKSRISALKPVQNRLVKKADTAVALFHEASLRSMELWTSGPREKALDRSLLILHTSLAVNNSPEPAHTPQIIRHYDLGISPRVKDTRSGRTTTRVDRVFKGYLDALLLASE